MAETGVRKQRAAQTEAELKAAAIRVFARVGYLNTKITDITAEAGRATGSFYQHFAGKEQLLEALLADLLAEGDAGALLAGHSDDFSDRSAIRFHIEQYWAVYRRHRTVIEALRQAAIVDPQFDQVQQEMTRPDIVHLSRHMAKAAPSGDPGLLASIFSLLVSTFAATWIDKIPDDVAIETLTSFVYGGING
ncbi:TetR/AcrR family transcriptional regulator [Paractinoplanes rhizophilus]|jgi:AcrR family transcriptional regulator|uniref:TetR/AcrR family transcriptional regulator n=1 Tax=Paractinoplanes rhizophilus TaxID=1416877 RepID=A0ABW2HJN2_9ACTN|nr:TetR/AcrR family transcriptional regulator [Actinoplanes sp.]